jgi:ABC-type transport system involved in multi-copper enzyme maturation permease subunit
MTERDTARPLSLARGARGVFALTLDAMVWSRRSLLMGLLLGLPVLFAILYRAVLAAKLPAELTGYDLYGQIVALYYIRNVVPLAALFYATALIADEVEGRTITYLFTRPIRRASILLGKFAAYLVTTLSLSLPATVVTFLLLASARGFSGVSANTPELLRDLGALALGLAAYGAFFTLLGVLLRRPVIPGLLFIFAWELVANFPGYLPRLTITGWLRSLVSHRAPAEGFLQVFSQALPVGLSLLVLSALTAGCLALALRIFSSREYVLDQ